MLGSGNDDDHDDRKRCHCFKGNHCLTLGLILSRLCWSHRAGQPIQEGRQRQRLAGVRGSACPSGSWSPARSTHFLASARRFPCDSCGSRPLIPASSTMASAWERPRAGLHPASPLAQPSLPGQPPAPRGVLRGAACHLAAGLHGVRLLPRPLGLPWTASS